MKELGLNEIREKFLSFYESKGHIRHKSFSLVPEKDKSLLIINSGMAPLKPYFSGVETPPGPRMTTCQKCIRTGDIENVGKTARHGTFFEMLGSFSFGNYFKHESLQWGWELITKVFEMPEDRLWATIYEDDDEAYDIWVNEVKIDPAHIVRLGKDDNFWEIGLGPCGPCSEIYYDRGAEYGCGKPDCKPGCECDRYMEFWNHVFTQFSKQEDGSYERLAHPNIDTGMGLERMACILQGVDSIFDVDTIRFVLNRVCEMSGAKYEAGNENEDTSIRIITDHIRSATFMISDGIIPSNEGRGYVLRRLIRRAVRHGKLLGMKDGFLSELADSVAEVSGEAYPELVEKQSYIKKIISMEENKFAQTLENGMVILGEFMERLRGEKGSALSGESVFKLYDTFGFPLELTEEILEERGFKADIEGFRKAMERQRTMAREGRKDTEGEAWKEASVVNSLEGSTEFTGYSEEKTRAILKYIIVNNELVESAKEGDDAIFILDKTPFYATSGGQHCDSGVFTKGNASFCVLIDDVYKVNGLICHSGGVSAGKVHVGDEITAEVDIYSRNATARNHTATHLLHKALREVLGDHVAQAGSLVTDEELRFDFSHYEAMNKEQLAEVEDIVNREILKFTDVRTDILSLSEAKKAGATALFGEKYGDEVRMVSIGDFSKELCGGTHVANTGQIGVFKIVSENGISSGVRRITAVTGTGLLDKARETESLVNAIGQRFKVLPGMIMQRLEGMSDEIKSLKKELEETKKANMGSEMDDMLADAKEIKGVKLITRRFTGVGVADLRNLSDDVKKDAKGTIMVFAAENDGKINFLVSVTDDLLDKGYHAGNMIKKIAAAAGGGGGGKADMATAGGKDASKIDEALALAESLV